MANRGLVTDNARQAAKILLKRLGIKVSLFSINWFSNHPQYPSLFAFSRLFEKLNLVHSIIRVSSEELSEIPRPFLTHFHSDGGGFFMVVDEVNEHNMRFINEKGIIEDFPKNIFLSNWTGVAAIFDPKGHEKEDNLFTNSIMDMLGRSKMPLFIVSLVLTFGFIIWITGLGSYSTINLFFLTTKIIGLFVSLILMIQTFDEHNLFFQKICSSKQEKSKVNCSSILDSKGAKLFGLFSWSEIGFVYFLSLLIFLLFFPGKGTSILVGLISVLAAPYPLYSVWYQKYIIGTWCRLCLFVQAILLVDSILALTLIEWNFSNISGAEIVGLLLIGLLFSSGYSCIKPIIKGWMKTKKELPALKRLKFDSEVFSTLQQRIRPIKLTPQLNPILFGNPDGKHKIIIVSNPVCKPCQKAHRTLFGMLNYKKNTSISEIFITGLDQNHEAYKTALFMLHLRKQLSDEHFLEEIELFYTAFGDNPEKWKKRFPDLKMEDTDLIETLEWQNQWCNELKITSTPVVFYNNKIVSGIYSINDLDYLVD